MKDEHASVPLPPALLALGVVEPVLKAPGGEPGYPDGFTREQLEGWAEQGLLGRSHHETYKTCPSCGSIHLLLRESCGACASTDLLAEDLIYHFECAHVFASRGERGAIASCPKCHQPVDLQSGRFEKNGRIYRCQACQALSAEPRQTFACLACGGVIERGQASTLRLHAYRPVHS